jgi:hypothetical protein
VLPANADTYRIGHSGTRTAFTARCGDSRDRHVTLLLAMTSGVKPMQWVSVILDRAQREVSRIHLKTQGCRIEPGKTIAMAQSLFLASA